MKSDIIWEFIWYVHPFANGKKMLRPEQGHRIKSLKYPVWVIRNHEWYFLYISALIQVRFPKHSITRHLNITTPEIPENILHKRRISAAKAQVTKIGNAIIAYHKEASSQLFGNEEVLKLLQRKLKEKEFNLKKLIDVQENLPDKT